MTQLFTPRALPDNFCERSLGRFAGAPSASGHVKDAGLVVAIISGDEHIPEVRTKQRPESKGFAVNSRTLSILHGMPRFSSPPDLFVHLVAKMNFCNRNR